MCISVKHETSSHWQERENLSSMNLFFPFSNEKKPVYGFNELHPYVTSPESCHNTIFHIATFKENNRHYVKPCVGTDTRCGAGYRTLRFWHYPHGLTDPRLVHALHPSINHSTRMYHTRIPVLPWGENKAITLSRKRTHSHTLTHAITHERNRSLSLSLSLSL